MSTILKVIFKLALILVCVSAVIVIAAYIFLSAPGSEETRVSSPASQSPLVSAPVVTSSASDGLTMSLQVTEQQAADIITDATSDVFPINDLQISFDDDGSATLSGTISKTELKESSFIDTLPDAMKLATELLPEQMNVSLDFNPQIDENGNIDLGAQSCSIGGLNIDAKYLPDSLFNSVNSQISSYAAQNGISVTDISVQDGQLVLSGNVGY